MSKIAYRAKSMWLALFKIPKKPPSPPYNHIVQLGDPILRYKADPVPLNEINSPEITQVLKRMSRAMKIFDIAGISAPQLGVGKRIMAFHFPDEKNSAFDEKEYKAKEMEEVRLQCWINPEMRIIDYEKVAHSEGCASLKGLCADVPRYKKVSLKGYDVHGKEQTLEASGWTARIIQHEMDHLNGVFYTDIMDPKTLQNTGWQYINLLQGRVTLNYGPFNN